METELVNKAWDALEEVLRELAPKTHATLRPGAPEEDFRALEHELGFPTPEPLRALYVRYNGEVPTEEASDGLFEQAYWMPLVSATQENVLESHSMCMEAYSSLTPQELDLRFEGPVRQRAFDPKWVPFATDFSGNYLCFDFNPPARGSYGQILWCDYEDECRISVVAPSISDLLLMLNEDLRSGERVIEERGFLETTVRIPNVKDRVFDSILTTSTLKEMGVVMRVLNPEVVNDPSTTSHFLRRPDVDPQNCVAYSVYAESNPCEKILEGQGGDTQIVESSLWSGDKRLSFGESGCIYRRYDPRYFCLLPVFFWALPERVPSDAVLEVTIRRRKKIPEALTLSKG